MEDPYKDWINSILRITQGKDAPSNDWQPDYKNYLTVGELTDNNMGYLINMNPSTGTKFSFEGSSESPFEYAPGFEVWHGAILFDKIGNGILTNGTNFRHIKIENNNKLISEGSIQNWKAVVKNKRTIPFSK